MSTSAMRHLCILLVSCATFRLSNATCFDGFVNTEPAQPLRPAQPQTWAQLKAGCAAAHVGHTLLRFVDALSDAERAACGNVVPYGVYEEIDSWGSPQVKLYWAAGREVLRPEDLSNLTYIPHGTRAGVAAIDLTTGRWVIVPKTQTFKCALCQLGAKEQRPNGEFPSFLPDNMELLMASYTIVFEVVLVDEAKDSERNAIISDQELKMLEDELKKLFDLGDSSIDLSGSPSDRQGRDELYIYLGARSWVVLNAIEAHSAGKVHLELAGRYVLRSIRRLSPCQVEDYPEGYQLVVSEAEAEDFGANVLGPKFKTFGENQFLVDPDRELVSQRRCFWDNETSALAWGSPTYWRTLWRECSAREEKDEYNGVDSIVSPIRTRRIEKRLDNLTAGLIVSCTHLDEVANLAEAIVRTNNALPAKILIKLYAILLKTSLNDGIDVCLIDKERVHIIVSNLAAVHPVIGFKMKLPLPVEPHSINDLGTQGSDPDTSIGSNWILSSGYSKAKNSPLNTFSEPKLSPNDFAFDVTPPPGYQNHDFDTPSEQQTMTPPFHDLPDELNYEVARGANKIVDTCDAMRQTMNTTDSSTMFAVLLSNDLLTNFQQLAIIMVARKVYSRNSGSLETTIAREVYIELSTNETMPQIFLDDDGYYIDITYQYVNTTEDIEGDRILTSCVAWNSLTEAWTTMACRERKALQDSLTVCRCRTKHMTQNGGTLTGAFALKKAIDAEVFGYETLLQQEIYHYITSNNALIALTVIELMSSSFGLLSVLLTAICCKQWREDLGHKILMHMVLAITLNLVLGFTTDYVHLDTESVGCIAIGVLRHYSFLAMFMWMLVLSGLQMKRLMTVAGAKATSHLILKVALFAWGVPLLPIVFILAWNARIYRSDRYDRGYCYPEGVTFQVTVQAPAGLILIVNLLIFVAIVRHIFECGAGEKITKHSKNEKAQQMRRVATSIFIFFLFGFTWVLHYLSEQRVIKSDFLFEYLFLMTATTHISVLSLFFVILDDKVRAFWLMEAGKWSWSKK